MEKKRRTYLTLLDSESTVNSPFGSPRFTRDTFAFTFRNESYKLPALKPIQHRSARKLPRYKPLATPKDHGVSPNIRSLLNLRRFAKTVLSERDSEKEL